MQRRATVIVLDAVGAGNAPDAADFGDEGADTLGNLAKAVGGLNLPNLESIGLGNTRSLVGVEPDGECRSIAGTLTERSQGKDTTTGHWELMGVLTNTPPPTYPEGFPQDLISAFIRRTGRGVLGNIAASGTQIIDDLGAEHMETGDLIVYTSADSVFQIAAHESVVPLDELYSICRTARELLTGEHSVSRVIARPFVGEPGAFQRTPNRSDFSLEPPGASYLTTIAEAGLPVCGVGKIGQIFAQKGITRDVHTKSNQDGVDQMISVLREQQGGVIFVNLVETDMVWGHRRDPEGFHTCLQEFDARLPELMEAMGQNDLLVITADHGCDPTWRGSDHTREQVPLIAWSPSGLPHKSGIGGYFSDVGASICEWLGVNPPSRIPGVSFLAEDKSGTGTLEGAAGDKVEGDGA